MAEQTAKRAAARHKSEQAKSEAKVEENATDEAAAPEQPADAPAAPEAPPAPPVLEADDNAVPPPPPPPEAGLVADGPEVDPSAEFPVARLVARSDELLGVSAAVAEGVLAQGDDPTTFAAAQQAVREYLDGPVANTDETDEEA